MNISSINFYSKSYGTFCGVKPVKSNLVPELHGNSNARIPLNLEGIGCKFFGVDSRDNIFFNLVNHFSLTKIMERDKGIKATLLEPCFINVEDPANLALNKNKIWRGYKPRGSKSNAWIQGVTTLRAIGAARMNVFVPSVFGEGPHTIGLVVDNKSNTLYILDSLGNEDIRIKKCHEKIADLFDGNTFVSVGEVYSPEPFSEIIFSQKQQQSFNEYTCNNWTFANIDALTKALKRGVKIENSYELDKCLPDDINAILDMQRQYVIENKGFIENLV